MKRPPKYVQGFIDRHGRPRFYFRRSGFKTVPLPGLPWSPEFMGAYEEANGKLVRLDIGVKRTIPGTISDAIIRYFACAEFMSGLRPSTQAMRRAILERFRSEHGKKRLAKLEPEHVDKIIGKLKPYAQRNMLKTLRGLMAFAIRDRMITTDPTAQCKLTRVTDTGGFPTWTEDHIAAFVAKHPVGTRARLALALLLYTGQRRGDVVLIGQQHIKKGVLSIRQQKTKAEVDIPVLPELQEVLNATPSGHLTFLVTGHGKPFTAAGFGNWFRDMCTAAGLPKRLSAHGLRKAAATRFADHGATAHELMAWFGWKKITEAERYTCAANRKALAKGMVRKLRVRTKVSNFETRFDNFRK
jgi:integrase